MPVKKIKFKVDLRLPILNVECVSGYDDAALQNHVDLDNNPVVMVNLDECARNVLILTPLMIFSVKRQCHVNIPTYSKVKCSKRPNRDGYYILTVACTSFI